MSGTTTDLSDLTDEQRELLALLLEQEGVDVARSFVVPRRAPGAAAPLSYSQRRLWVTDRLAARGPFRSPNSNPNAWRISGPLSVPSLEQSLDALVRRHEVLRARCVLQNGELVQLAAPLAQFRLPVRDLRHLSPAARAAAAQQAVAEDAGRAFDLATGPLFRAELLRLDEAEHVFLLNHHYFVADGMSEGILLGELSALYAAFATGQEATLPELPIQYADFALWQREWMQGAARQEQLAYWKEQLRGCTLELSLPADRPRPAVQTFRGAHRGFVLPEGLSAAVRDVSRREGVTRFMLFLAAWQTVLHRYSGEDDVAVATTVSNRSRPEAERLVGFFSNNLFLRSRLGGNPTFRDLLRQAGEVAAGAYSHQDLPFEELLKELHLDPGAGGAPRLQTVLVLHQHATADNLQLPGLAVHRLAQDKGTATFELALRLADGAPAFSGSVEYSTDLFDAVTIAGVMQDFQAVLEQLVADPQRRIGDVALPSPLSRRPGGQADAAAALLPAAEGEESAAYVAPRDDLERRLAQVWEGVLHVRPVGISRDFFELGGNSLLAVQLFARIKQVFGPDLPLETLFRAPTIAACARVIAGELGITLETEVPAPVAASVGEALAPAAGGAPPAAMAPQPGRPSTSWSPLVLIQRGTIEPPFFCVHGAGGNVLFFRDLIRQLSPDLTVYGLQARGVDGKLAPLTRIEDMAAHYVEAIRTVQPKGPYLLGGYSGGGVIAFEMAQQLLGVGEETALLAFVDTLCPGFRVLHNRAGDRLRRLREDGLLSVARGWSRRAAFVQATRLKSWRVAAYRRLGRPVPHHLREHWMTTLYLEAQERYRPAPYSGRLALFRAIKSDPTAKQAGRELGWGDVVCGGIDVYDVPGDHDTLIVKPNVNVLGAQLSSCLDATYARLRE